MSEVNDFQFKVILQCEQEEFNPTRKEYCEYLVEMNGVERPLRDILKENIEQQAIIEALKEKLCEFGVSDVKINGKRINTGLEEWLDE